jgi:hypothetical protein
MALLLSRQLARVQFRDIRRTVKMCTLETDEFPLLEAVARERLLTQQAGKKGLTGSVVICELWRLAVVL